jgi:hypothetical protein
MLQAAAPLFTYSSLIPTLLNVALLSDRARLIFLE